MERSCDAREPTGNVKCIVFTIILAVGYWFLPYRNKWVLLAILYGAYLAMAWYDYWYQCQRNLGATYLAHFYDWAKPYYSEQMKTYRAWCPEIKRKVRIVDLIILIILVALFPLFLKWQPKN